MSYPCDKGEQWSKLYEYVTFPSESFHRPFDSAGQSRVLIQSEPEPRRSDVRQIYTSVSSSSATMTPNVISHSAIDSSTFRTSRKAISAPNVMSLNLPLVGVPRDENLADHHDSLPQLVSPDDAARQNEKDIHVYPCNRPSGDSLTSSASSLCSIDARSKKEFDTIQSNFSIGLF